MVYNEKEKVDSKFNDIAGILPSKENVHIMEKSSSFFVAQSKGEKSLYGSYNYSNVLLSMSIFHSIKAMSNAIDVDSDVDSYDTDDADDFQSMEFVKDLIVTPPMTHGKVEVGSDVLTTVKRNYQSTDVVTIAPSCSILMCCVVDLDQQSSISCALVSNFDRRFSAVGYVSAVATC
ncbi:hypothetical protein QL285_009516 [Trifolium repens]|nr:hypothetical protein QL285_009516 [Trifolium repens]